MDWLVRVLPHDFSANLCCLLKAIVRSNLFGGAFNLFLLTVIIRVKPACVCDAFLLLMMKDISFVSLIPVRVFRAEDGVYHLDLFKLVDNLIT